MPKRLILDNLPWIAPSVAIVLAASGYFDRSNPAPVVVNDTIVSEPEPSVTVPDVASLSLAASPDVTRNATPTPTLEGVKAAAAALAEKPIATPAALRQQKQPVIAAAPAPAAPEVVVTPVATAPVVAPTEDPAAFFNAAQARLALANSCVADLERLAERTRIYFPSGGLSGSEEGLAQARVIALVAQDCPSVSIEVRGHSDASGNPRTNLVLSQQRADAIITRLSASGVDTSRFIAKGIGDREPSGVTGPLGNAFYDRRVEFTVVKGAAQAAFTPTQPDSWGLSACVVALQEAVQNARLFYQPGSVMPQEDDWATAFSLVEQAANCPGARLRVIGQHAEQIETFSTARLRAITLMSGLVGAGFDSGEIIVAAPSRPTDIAGAPELSDSRVDFDVILEES